MVPRDMPNYVHVCFFHVKNTKNHVTVIWKWLWQSCLRMTLPHEPPQKLWDGYRLPEMVQTWDKRWGLPNSHTPFEGWVIGVHIHHYHHCPLNDTTQICHNYIIFVQTYDRRWTFPNLLMSLLVNLQVTTAVIPIVPWRQQMYSLKCRRLWASPGFAVFPSWGTSLNGNRLCKQSATSSSTGSTSLARMEVINSVLADTPAVYKVTYTCRFYAD